MEKKPNWKILHLALIYAGNIPCVHTWVIHSAPSLLVVAVGQIYICDKLLFPLFIMCCLLPHVVEINYLLCGLRLDLPTNQMELFPMMQKSTFEDSNFIRAPSFDDTWTS